MTVTCKVLPPLNETHRREGFVWLSRDTGHPPDETYFKPKPSLPPQPDGEYVPATLTYKVPRQVVLTLSYDAAVTLVATLGKAEGSYPVYRALHNALYPHAAVS